MVEFSLQRLAGLHLNVRQDTRYMATETTQRSSISFLDVIACAFGAIVLMVLILPIGQNAVEQPGREDLSESGRLFLALDVVTSEIEVLQAQWVKNQALLEGIRSETVSLVEAQRQAAEAVAAAQEQLSAVQKQKETLDSAGELLRRPVSVAPKDVQVESEYAGIPVDSEYVAFVVDTSGSMQSIWHQVIREVERFMLLYPDMKGFQIMNDNGHYLSRIGRGRWIPDSNTARNQALKKMDTWFSYSNSSPAEGILQAIDDLYRDDLKMAIVVVGDEYSDQRFTGLLGEIENKVTSRDIAEGSLRIHALGFWNDVGETGDHFGVLMRALTERYNGAFVAYEETSFPFMDPVEGFMKRIR